MTTQSSDQNVSMKIEDATKLVTPKNIEVPYIFLSNISNILKVVAERGAFKMDEFYDIGTIYKELNTYLETRVKVNVDTNEKNVVDNKPENKIADSIVNNNEANNSTNNTNNDNDNEDDIKIAL